MVQFLSINFFCWISSIFVGFFKSSHFFVSLCIILYMISLLCWYMEEGYCTEYSDCAMGWIYLFSNMSRLAMGLTHAFTCTLHCIYCRCNVWCPTWLSVIVNMRINWERRSTKLYTFRSSYGAVWAWVVLQDCMTTYIIGATDTLPVKLVVAAQTLKEIQLCK